MASTKHTTVVRHWLPRFTICPYNSLPDLIYVQVEFQFRPNEFAELYSVRRTIADMVPFGHRRFMEDIAVDVLRALPAAKKVTVSLLFNRHTASVER